MIVLGIDPGLTTGWAVVFVEPTGLTLGNADLGDPRKDVPNFRGHVVIEKPVIYPHAKENPNSLITLAIQVGRYVEAFEPLASHLTLVEARTWKGQVPKSVTMSRVCAKFPNARHLLNRHASGLQHNVSDAIGLALWHASRLMVKR
jgi:hypothetical protein